MWDEADVDIITKAQLSHAGDRAIKKFAMMEVEKPLMRKHLEEELEIKDGIVVGAIVVGAIV